METDCDNGTFGKDCKQACGKCLREEQCDHVNGTCLNGCDAGYQGLECAEGNIIELRQAKKDLRNIKINTSQ